MSEFLYHEPCPSCNSRDNLGVWDDGHKYCFGCGYQEGGVKSLEYIKSLHKNNNKKESDHGVTLPSDYSLSIPAAPTAWLNNYGITPDEVYRYKLGWSERMQRLIVPIYGADKNLLFWQGRQFGNFKGPKYLTEGKGKDILTIFQGPTFDKDRIILCEDAISAIKIARQENVMCLFGSIIGTNMALRLSRTFSRIWIWLDRDKADYALKARLRVGWMYGEAKTIISDRDPKSYSDDEIKEYLK